jgi:hypothetical protein
MSLLANKLTPTQGKRWLKPVLVIVLIIVVVSGLLIYRHHVLEKKRALVEMQPAIRITLLNGCGFDGAAKDMTDFLTDKNIDIVSTGNAAKFIYNKTIIVVKKMDRDDLLRLMSMTGITQWTLAESEFSVAPFVIVIGKDYQELIANQKKK